MVTAAILARGPRESMVICGWGEIGDQCCPFFIIITASIGSIVVCFACMALALYVWQPRVSTMSLASATEDLNGPVRITLPAHLSNSLRADDIDIRIYAPAHSTTELDPTGTDSSRRQNTLAKKQPSVPQPIQFSRRDFESAADSINYFTSDPPSSHRPSTIISHYSMYAFSELSSEASNNLSSVVDGASTYMPMMDEMNVGDSKDSYSQASYLSTNKTFANNFKQSSSFASSAKSAEKQRRQNTRKNRSARTGSDNFRRTTTARTRLESDFSGASSAVDSASVISSTVTEVHPFRPMTSSPKSYNA